MNSKPFKIQKPPAFILIAGIMVNYLIISYRHGEFKEALDAIYHPILIGFLLMASTFIFLFTIRPNKKMASVICFFILLLTPFLLQMGTDWIKNEYRKLQLKKYFHEIQQAYKADIDFYYEHLGDNCFAIINDYLLASTACNSKSLRADPSTHKVIVYKRDVGMIDEKTFEEIVIMLLPSNEYVYRNLTIISPTPNNDYTSMIRIHMKHRESERTSMHHLRANDSGLIL